MRESESEGGVPGWRELVRENSDAPPAGAPERAAMLLRLQRSAGNASVLGLLREVAPPSAAPGPGAPAAGRPGPAGPLLADGASAGPGQMPAGAFLDALHQAVSTVAERELGGSLFQLRGCPWIDHWIAYYRGQPAAKIEAAVRRYAPDAAGAATAEDYIAAVSARVSAGIATWRKNGQVPDLPADSPGAPPGEPTPRGAGSNGAGEPQARGEESDGAQAAPGFKLRPNSPQPTGEAAALAGRLGPGEPLAGDVRDQVGGAFGADLSAVRIHRDPGAAQAVSSLGARAATVGNDVAFAPGEYEPGTPVGDALIAHELAHVVQQGAGGGGVSDTATLEQDADMAAISAVAGRWAPGFERPGAHAPMPAAGGLRLQRCPSKTYEKDSEELAKDAGIAMTYEPEMEKLPVGLEARFQLTSGTDPNKTKGVSRWATKGPGDKDMQRETKVRPQGRVTIVFDRPGEWLVAAQFGLHGKNVIISRTFTVVPADDVANEALGKTPPADYITHRQRLAEERMKRAKGGVLDQNTGGAYITNEGPGAANPAPTANSTPLRFAVHPGPQEPGKPPPVKYRWWAIPRNHADKLSDRKDIGKWDLYPYEPGIYARAVFRGEGERASFIRNWPVEVEMVCELLSADDQLVGKARYKQVVLDDTAMKGVKQIDAFMKDAGKHYRLIKDGKAEGLRASHLDVRTGQITQLSLFVGPSASGSGITLVDLTPGAERAEYDGATVKEAIEDFADGNAHGKGRIDVEHAGPPPLRMTMKTTGSSGLEERAAKVGLAGLLIAGVGALAALTPLAPAAPYLIATGLGVGAVASTASIVAELRKAKPSATKVAIDMTSVVSSLAGVGLAAKAMQVGTVELAMMSTVGRMAVYTGFASDAFGGVLIAADTAAQIERIRASKLSEDDKIDAISRLISQMVITGTFIVFGSKDLGATRSRAATVLGDDIAGGLKPDVLYGLHNLDDAALLSLKGLERAEIDTIASALARDPRGAERLSKAYGKQFIDEVRANPARSFDEIDDILAARAAHHTSAGQVGGVHGWDHPTEAGKGIASLSPDRLRNALKPIAASSRIHATKWVGVEAKKNSALITLEVTPKDGPPFKLVVSVEMQPGGAVATGAQKGSGRVAQLEPPKTADGAWTMRYEIDGDLLPDALPHVLGRGLDEASDWIATRGGAKTPFSNQVGPSLFTPWAARGPGAGTPPITHGDRAAARELLGVAADIRRIEAEITKAALGLRKLEKDAAVNAAAIKSSQQAIAVLEGKLKNRQATYEAMRLDMGLYDPQHLEAKLKLLRDTAAGMTSEANLLGHAEKQGLNAVDRLIADAQTVASETEHRVLAAGVKPTLTQEDVTHLMRPNPRGKDFKEWGISGGHYDPNLREFVRSNPEYALVKIEDVQSGSVKFVHYEQYKWKGTGPPPKPGDPRYPVKGTPVSATDWESCVYPKTTFDNPDAFLAYANGEVQAWKAKQKPPVARGNHEVGGVPPLVIVAEITADGTLNVSTIYIKAGWIDATGAAQKSPTPVPT